MVHRIYAHGAVDLVDEQGHIFKVNGHRVKKFYDKDGPNEEVRASWALVLAD